MQYAWGSNVGIQLMNEVAGNVRGHSGVLINTPPCAELGIEEGDLVEVSSYVGTTRGTGGAGRGHPRRHPADDGPVRPLGHALRQGPEQAEHEQPDPDVDGAHRLHRLIGRHRARGRHAKLEGRH
jgi:hypothetical protein